MENCLSHASALLVFGFKNTQPYMFSPHHYYVGFLFLFAFPLTPSHLPHHAPKPNSHAVSPNTYTTRTHARERPTSCTIYTTLTFTRPAKPPSGSTLTASPETGGEVRASERPAGCKRAEPHPETSLLFTLADCMTGAHCLRTKQTSVPQLKPKTWLLAKMKPSSASSGPNPRFGPDEAKFSLFWPKPPFSGRKPGFGPPFSSREPGFGPDQAKIQAASTTFAKNLKKH